MKKIIVIIWGLLGGMTGFAQNNQNLKENIRNLISDQVTRTIKTEDIHQKLGAYIQFLTEKRPDFKNDRKFLKFVFFHTHRKFLKQYEMYKDFEEIFDESKKYNCVSGTTLYALILKELGYKYTVRETAFHVYLVVHTKKTSKILFDSTDPHQGFLYNAHVIRKRERHYTENKQQKFNQAINLSQLIGLQYYNQGIHQFNQKIFGQALVKLSRAYQHYPTDRIKALQELAQSYYKMALSER